MMHSSGDGFLY